MVWQIGQRVKQGEFEICRAIENGEGGFGITYIANQVDLGREVVIKTPNEKFQKAAEYERVLKTFRREARMLARLERHTNIVQIISYFEEGNLPCLVLEFIRGKTVKSMVEERGGLPEKQVIDIFSKIAQAVAFIHGKALVHRDLNPGNIMVRGDGEPILIDFGLTREIVPNASTNSGHFGFAPWEQIPLEELFPIPIQRPAVSAVSDVYCLAASAYFAATGQPPALSVKRKIQKEVAKIQNQSPSDCLVEPAQLSSQISGGLNQAILRGMALEPGERPQTMVEFSQLLAPPLVEGVKLVRFRFKTVRVDERGKIKERRRLEAEQFVEDLGNGVTLEMVRIPRGKFWMGSEAGEEGSRDSERPRHRVAVPEFCMGKFAVTQAQYRLVMGTNPSHFKGDQRPVERVSWHDAQAFCEKLSDKTGCAYRLPSEAEWEYACRAGTTTPFYFGETITPELVNYRGGFTFGKGPKGQYRQHTTDVGRFPPNAFGLHDMHGNIWEWCLDRGHDTYAGAPSDASAWTTIKDDGVLCVQRGGSWFDLPRSCRSAQRFRRVPSIRISGLGFRVVCAAPRT